MQPINYFPLVKSLLVKQTQALGCLGLRAELPSEALVKPATKERRWLSAVAKHTMERTAWEGRLPKVMPDT